MDLTERSRTAISAAATPVDASVLSELERARMLYRHAKAKKLPTPVKQLIRHRARRVIDNKKFTPERLRRLIDDVAENGVEYVFDSQRFDEAIRRCLNTASESMRQVFKAFPETPRWILVVAAELGERPSEQRLYQRLQAHRPKPLGLRSLRRAEKKAISVGPGPAVRRFSRISSAFCCVWSTNTRFRILKR